MTDFVRTRMGLCAAGRLCKPIVYHPAVFKFSMLLQYPVYFPFIMLPQYPPIRLNVIYNHNLFLTVMFFHKETYLSML